jgi:hypothetical protein
MREAAAASLLTRHRRRSSFVDGTKVEPFDRVRCIQTAGGTPMTKLMGVILALTFLAGCAASPGGDGQAAAKVAAATCMSQADAARLTCEQGCPTATGNEHFSVQHKIARENLACKETCGTTHAQTAAQCSSAR